ncbi:hypothetical protein [Kribbella sp. CA-293567]|uniref:hypothetical protein n=1 Tax=Kribbella sp. CA-293567 TaxID=3002436 RepID=UPI0022DDE298|nr:hypothetical protein [Kribbella sp. CA-293567]WBQ05945.1 hypothetical protein OX958_03870 [Kribbella sp. CA-293567]
MKTPVLVSGIVLLALVGACGGYWAGPLLNQRAEASGPAAPLAGSAAGQTVPPPSPSPSATPSVPLIRKTPQPNPLEPLVSTDLEFRTRNFTVSSEVAGEVKLSIKVPAGWQLTPSKDKPSEVRFVDASGERAIRIESALTPDKPVQQALQDVLTNVQSSQPYQNFVRPLFQGSGQVKDSDGQLRQVATLVYTYIPGATSRYVIVRFVATGDGDLATISMSVTGLPKEQKALERILAEATSSVRIRD